MKTKSKSSAGANAFLIGWLLCIFGAALWITGTPGAVMAWLVAEREAQSLLWLTMLAIAWGTVAFASVIVLLFVLGLIAQARQRRKS